MKFNQVMALVMVIFFAIFAGGVVHTQASVEYAQVLEVVEIKDDLVYMIDWNGNEWIWEGAEDWNIGDFAAATMNTNGTEIIYDDIIVNLRYTRIAER
jgi:hypothetical protein